MKDIKLGQKIYPEINIADTKSAAMRSQIQAASPPPLLDVRVSETHNLFTLPHDGEYTMSSYNWDGPTVPTEEMLFYEDESLYLIQKEGSRHALMFDTLNHWNDYDISSRVLLSPGTNSSMTFSFRRTWDPKGDSYYALYVGDNGVALNRVRTNKVTFIGTPRNIDYGANKEIHIDISCYGNCIWINGEQFVDNDPLLSGTAGIWSSEGFVRVYDYSITASRTAWRSRLDTVGFFNPEKGIVEEMRGVNLGVCPVFAMHYINTHPELWDQVMQFMQDSHDMGARIVRVMTGFQIYKDSIRYDFPYALNNEVPFKYPPFAQEYEIRHETISMKTYIDCMEDLLAFCEDNDMLLLPVLFDGLPESIHNTEYNVAPLKSSRWITDSDNVNIVCDIVNKMVMPFKDNPHIFSWQLFNEPVVDDWFLTRSSDITTFSTDSYIYFLRKIRESINGITQMFNDGLWSFTAIGMIQDPVSGDYYKLPDNNSLSSALIDRQEYLDIVDWLSIHIYGSHAEQVYRNIDWAKEWFMHTGKPVLIDEIGKLWTNYPEASLDEEAKYFDEYYEDIFAVEDQVLVWCPWFPEGGTDLQYFDFQAHMFNRRDKRFSNKYGTVDKFRLTNRTGH